MIVVVDFTIFQDSDSTFALPKHQISKNHTWWCAHYLRQEPIQPGIYVNVDSIFLLIWDQADA